MATSFTMSIRAARSSPSERSSDGRARSEKSRVLVVDAAYNADQGGPCDSDSRFPCALLLRMHEEQRSLLTAGCAIAGSGVSVFNGPNDAEHPVVNTAAASLWHASNGARRGRQACCALAPWHPAIRSRCG